jgi:hypothetical protein
MGWYLCEFFVVAMVPDGFKLEFYSPLKFPENNIKFCKSENLNRERGV